MSTTAGAYPFDHAARGELDRLQALAEVFDSTTRGLLAPLVRQGWRCWDVGSGAGAVSDYLVTAVGAVGKVVASDIDTRFLGPIAARGAEVVEHDITSGAIPGAEFDLVVARFLLEWLPGRDEALRHMVAALRPGGLLVVEDLDWGTRIAASDPPELDEAFSAAVALMNAGGCETECGQRNHGRLEALGLERVSGRTVSPLARGGQTAEARWCLGSFDRLLPGMVKTRLMTEHEVDATAKSLADPRSRFWLPPVVAAWGWKAAG